MPDVSVASAVIEFAGYPVRWIADDTGQYRPQIVDQPEQPVTWAPLPGSQEAFLNDDTFEVLYAGARGGGKSECGLMDFARDVGKGYGTAWKGLLFRRTYGELAEVIAKAQRWYPAIFGARATYNHTAHTWTFPEGEQLTFAFIDSVEDYRKYHGWERPWIGFEELTAWPSDEHYRRVLSTMRTTDPRVPQRVRSNSNPSGPGHSWTKARFHLPLAPGQIVGNIIHTPGERDRRVICGSFHENVLLHAATPDYADSLRTAATSLAEERAWLENDWNIVAGGMFDDVWRPDVHIVPPVPLTEIPRAWRLDRSYDDGTSAPFSVGWWAQSNGEPIVWEGRELGSVRGDLIRVQEWYGWNGKRPNVGLSLASRDIAAGIVERETIWGVRGRVLPGPADTAIWNASPTDQRVSVASEMAKVGVTWERADKGPGSRIQGWRIIRDLFNAAVPDAEGRRTRPGLFVSRVCQQFIRTIPVLPRDPRNPMDVDTASEDHQGDDLRYRARRAISYVGPPTLFLPH